MLHVKDGWLYYGAARLAIQLTDDGFQFAVKEKWLRPEYGPTVIVPIGTLLKLWVAHLMHLRRTP